ncbi:MAG TPA: biotin/lipoyl-binding protein [Polyangia bacterium]
MRSNILGSQPRLRRILPWALWGLAAIIGLPMAISQAGIGSSPAIVEPHVALLSPMRTDHRLRISKILVQPGQSVKAGEVLVQMDTSELDADLAIAQAKLAYVEIMAGWKQIRMLDDRTRTSHELATTAERAAIDVARIIAEAERDRSELAQLETNLDLEQKLVNDQLAGADRLKAMKLQRAALAKKVQEYQAAVNQARKSASGSTKRLGDWRQDKQNKQNKKGATPEVASTETQTLQSDVRAAAGTLQRQEIARLDFLRTYYQIRAPFDGRVGEILAHIGELSADPAIPLITVVQEQSQTAIAYLRQDGARKIHLGDLVKLVPRDLSGPPLKGRVTALSPSMTEMPVRFRRMPNLIEFGRNVYIALDTPIDLPGQAYDAVFNRPSGGGR